MNAHGYAAIVIVIVLALGWASIKLWPRAEKFLGWLSLALFSTVFCIGIIMAIYAVLTGQGCGGGSRHDLIEERDTNYDGG